MSLTEAAVQWRGRGHREKFRGRNIHTFHQPGSGSEAEPLLLLLHGFPTCSYDWRHLIELLPKQGILAPDFLGFGFSDKPRDHTYTLSWQADLVEDLVCRHRNGRSVYICAHDLGTSVGTELLARDLAGELEFPLAGMQLSNGSILLERSNPTLAQKLLRGSFGPIASRFTNETFFRNQFRSIFSDSHPVTDSDLQDYWSIMCFQEGHRLGHKLVSYMDERVVYADRWHGAIERWPGDLRLVWGLRDPVAVPEVLEGLIGLRPAAPVTRFEDLGHYPQVEDPDRFMRVLAESMAASATAL